MQSHHSGHIGVVTLEWSHWSGHIGVVTLEWSHWSGHIGVVTLEWSHSSGHVIYKASRSPGLMCSQFIILCRLAVITYSPDTGTSNVSYEVFTVGVKHEINT